MRRGELRGAAAALGERQASERPRELVGARGQALHGAPGDDDAGLPSVPEERRRCFRRPWRSTISTSAGRTRRIRSAKSSRRGGRTASWRRRLYAVDSAVGRTSMGGARRGLAGDVRGSAATREPGDGGIRTAGSGCTYRPNNLRPHRALVSETKRDSPAARLLGRHDALARQHEHDAPVRDAVLRHRSTRLRPRSVLPHPRHRQPVRRRCVVLSLRRRR